MNLKSVRDDRKIGKKVSIFPLLLEVSCRCFPIRLMPLFSDLIPLGTTYSLPQSLYIPAAPFPLLNEKEESTEITSDLLLWQFLLSISGVAVLIICFDR